MTPSSALPIEPQLPAIVETIARRGAAVVVAQPGAGKTTRLPPALLAALGERGEVWVAEPRRIAARLAANEVAEQLGTPTGDLVGYEVRGERRVSRATRLRYLTDGLLVRRLVGGGALRHVAAIVLDEVHERRLATDLALALVDRLRRETRPDLALVCMSATVDGAQLAERFDAALLEVPGRSHPVEVQHLPHRSDEPLERLLARTLDELLESDPHGGDVLVFLPGMAEIRAAERTLAPLCTAAGIEIAPLHGALGLAAQRRALRPHGPRRVVLATNVAESSVTLPRVRAVIDTGWEREAEVDPHTGLAALRLRPISRASARQRAGRAGRLGPGVCRRLYTRRDFEGRAAAQRPEIERADLSELVLLLRSAGVRDPHTLRWWSPPPERALERAGWLLTRLGALGPDGSPTALGRRMARHPLPPRLARLWEAAIELRAGPLGAAAVAVLAEPDRGRRKTDSASDTPSDVLLAAHELLGGRASVQARRLHARLLRDTPGWMRAEPPEPDAAETAVLQAILLAFPDRVALRRGDGDRRVRLCDGSGGELSRDSTVRTARWLVAVRGERDGRGGLRIESASAIEPEWLLDRFAEHVSERVEVRWNAQAERVEVTSALVYGELALERSAAPPGAHAQAVSQRLREQALRAGPQALCDPEALADLRARIAFARRFAPALPEPDDDWVRTILGRLCTGRRSFAELRAADLLAVLAGEAQASCPGALERFAPARVRLPSGRRVRVHYEAGREPWIALWIQDAFGAREGPRVGGGRVPVLLHLLAPNRRVVQITTDLAGFWERHYPRIRRELRRRYPRHRWPEDPLAARPGLR